MAVCPREGNQHALERMLAAGAQMTSWIQVLLEFQRDWTRHATYEGARSIVESKGGGYFLAFPERLNAVLGTQES